MLSENILVFPAKAFFLPSQDVSYPAILQIYLLFLSPPTIVLFQLLKDFLDTHPDQWKFSDSNCFTLTLISLSNSSLYFLYNTGMMLTIISFGIIVNPDQQNPVTIIRQGSMISFFLNLLNCSVCRLVIF